MKKIILIFIFGILLNSCASTGVKDMSSLIVDRSDLANIYFKRQSGFMYMGVRANVFADGIKQGSLYPKEYIKFFLSEGSHTITIKADPLSGVIGKTIISSNVFFPKPKVDSTLLTLYPKENNIKHKYIFKYILFMVLL